ncbi:MAG: polysaccharide biosynthesis protein [Candidatus Brocadiaceae bacterium]|nr:polysaccharide biosynthesis protein [Candidatus Brocadiaceae bacterium]
MFSLFLFCGLRISKRVFLKYFLRRSLTKYGKRTIIIGAGDTGSMIIRNLIEGGYQDYIPVGILDNDSNKVGKNIHGVPVFATTDELEGVIKKKRIHAVVIAIPSLDHQSLRKLYNSANKHEVEIKIIPRLYDVHRPSLSMQNLEDISIEDLLGRQVVETDHEGIEQFLRDKVVLITGAGGSIGSEIAMQVCSFNPQKVILFDIDETELHYLQLKLEKIFPHLFRNRFINSQMLQKVLFITGDIRDEEAVTKVFRNLNPQIVFHAAAYKHVPMMEYNSKEAVKVNMFGTYRVAKASIEHKIEKFVMISSDKAVRPTSIMGATKRMAEHICMACGEVADTEFLSVRFGNVLGSRGSVLPLFLDQLKEGGPLTVTHKDVLRYFMTIYEAVSLVLQASVLGRGGDILVLDMGKPVKLLSLAEDLIRIHGLEPYRDIDIKITGLRPGEKLYEETLTAEEGTTASKHKKIFFAKNSHQFSLREVETLLREFETTFNTYASMDHYECVRDMLKKHVSRLERRSSGNPRNTHESYRLQVGKKSFAFIFLDKEMEEEANKQFRFSKAPVKQDYTFIVGYQDNKRLYKDWETVDFEQERWFCRNSTKEEKRVFFPKKEKTDILKYVLWCIYSEFFKNGKNGEKRNSNFFLRAGGLIHNGVGFALMGIPGDVKNAISTVAIQKEKILSDEFLVVTEDEGNYFISSFPFLTDTAKGNNNLIPLNTVFLVGEGMEHVVRRLSTKELFLNLMSNVYFVSVSHDGRVEDVLPEKVRIISRIGNVVPAYGMTCAKDKSFSLENIDVHTFKGRKSRG